MLKAMLIVQNVGSQKWTGAGERQFVVLPRTDEYIEMDIPDEDGNPMGTAFKVVAVFHPGEPVGTTGDIYAVQVGRTIDVLDRLLVRG